MSASEVGAPREEGVLGREGPALGEASGGDTGAAPGYLRTQERKPPMAATGLRSRFGSEIAMKDPGAPPKEQSASSAAGEIGILARRRIEAGVIAPIYEEMCEAIGKERAQEILRRAIRRAAIQSGKQFAASAPGEPDLLSFQDIQHLWTKDDALAIEVIEQGPEKFDFNVRRCRYAETYREMGLGEIGRLLSCNRDGAFCEGYNPRIKLRRTQTIMEGASYCDFRYRFEREEKEEERG